MKNILFSTTVQWNPGDEFIFRGIRNLLSSAGLRYNSVVYNRNPLINPHRQPLGDWRRLFRPSPQDVLLRENSFFAEASVPIDYVIFAGTPEWSGGERSEEVLRLIRDRGLRCSFVGVGLNDQVTPSELLKTVLTKHTDLFLCRDQLTHRLFAELAGARLVTCPSILSSTEEKKREGPGRIGCGIQGTRMLWQRISPEQQNALYVAYQNLGRKYEIEYVSHYVDDWDGFTDKARPVHYSALSADYYPIYNRYDLVISGRLHGCGISASMGIPSVCLAHDRRGAAAELFGSVVVKSPRDIEAAVAATDWAARSRAVVEIKAKTAATYAELVKPLVDRLGS